MSLEFKNELLKYIRVIPDFPTEGVSFKDITPLLRDGEMFRKSIDVLKDACKDIDFDLIVAPEARGFIIGSALAYAMGKGFVPVRKKGKLPWQTIESVYELEYGTDTVEIHQDAVEPGQKVVVLDDLLATGGTIAATVDLVERLGGQIAAIVFLIELTYIPGRAILSEKGYDIISVVKLDE
ncbi:MAG TPA: adenine phosphoribosyltransferase [Bacillota bacterium]|jgi:adenine phosphoribosyltransferase|nr:adenine phosphoribosyltransferase [Candidatus Fermentithermobacillaceae bacterium]HOB30707.1 adenine phosphoribosyltransferase [Bacillota bacterium]HOK64563.1 adenine phosphoribosyltransferase [Bacillota bacterium]HOL12076.1 adenine phosphoribosyltransferase [Bacillota bacterium]HOQ03088.1 adenine phosphoribosyltransferase [Bacillota bacterium]